MTVCMKNQLILKLKKNIIHMIMFHIFEKSSLEAVRQGMIT